MIILKFYKYLALCCFFSFTHPLLAASRISIIRHGEEPPGEAWTLGRKGFLRAHALAAHFQKIENKPDLVYANIPDAKSGRSYETCDPVARALHTNVVLKYKREDVSNLAEELKDQIAKGSKSILVCWTNRNIKDLVVALGIEDTSSWNPDVWDDMWVVSFDLSFFPKLNITKQELVQTFEVKHEDFFSGEYSVPNVLKKSYPEEYKTLLEQCPPNSDNSIHTCSLIN